MTGEKYVQHQKCINLISIRMRNIFWRMKCALQFKVVIINMESSNYLVNAFVILEPGKVHLFNVAGVTGQRWGSRHGPGGAAPAVHTASGKARSTPAQPPTPPDTPPPQDTRQHPKLTHGYGDTIKRLMIGRIPSRTSEFRQTLGPIRWNLINHILLQMLTFGAL